MENSRHDRLDSWKAIAEYLGRDVRTAIRWEKEKGLPVHRVPGGKRHAVFAYPEELGAWLRGSAESIESAAQGSIEAAVLARPLATAPAQSPKSFSLPKHWYFVGISVIASLAILGFAVYQRALPDPPVRITHNGYWIQVWDAKGRLAWEHQFPGLLSNAEAVFGDRDGDGNNDFVAVVPIYGKQDETQSSEIYFFNDRGRILWSYAPNFMLSSGQRRFGAPWNYGAMTLTPKSKPKYIWIAFHQVLWWPGCLVRLDMEGRDSLRFINAGWITSLGSFESASGSWVLASGINNEYDQAMLAVISADARESASPHLAGSRYILDEQAQEHPYRYFLFPRSELNLATGHPVNVIYYIVVRPAEIEVRTAEAARGNSPMGIYLFSPEFNLTAVTRTDTYWDLHRQLEKEGLVKHSVEECPERIAPAIRGWDPESGWTIVRPQAFPASR